MKEHEAKAMWKTVKELRKQITSLHNSTNVLRQQTNNLSYYVQQNSPTCYWREFPQPDYSIPVELVELCETGVLTDISWGNDVAPSLSLRTDPTHVARVWIHPQDPSKREYPTERFIVTMDRVNEEGEILETGEPFIETEDLTEILEFISKNKK